MKSDRMIWGAAMVLASLGWSIVALAQSAGDAQRGEKIYQRCFACHAIDRDRTGPRHAGLFGRPAGGVAGFPYSSAMRQAGLDGLVWSEATLDRFLENPTGFMPGTRMGYAGVKDSGERADLIAYLKKVTAP